MNKFKVQDMTAEEAIDDELVNSCLGTLESFSSPYEAVKALCTYHTELGEYLAKTREYPELVKARSLLLNIRNGLQRPSARNSHETWKRQIDELLGEQEL